jgi:hypothetical protein
MSRLITKKEEERIDFIKVLLANMHDILTEALLWNIRHAGILHSKGESYKDIFHGEYYKNKNLWKYEWEELKFRPNSFRIQNM